MNSTENFPIQNPIQIWKMSYLQDVELIYEQQSKFLLLFKKLLTLPKDIDQYSQLSDIISELDFYTQMYFHQEETLMLKTNFKETGLHTLQHKLFKKKMEEFKIANIYKNVFLFEEMILFMQKWFFIHISEFDKRYLDSIKSLLIENKQKSTNLNYTKNLDIVDIPD